MESGINNINNDLDGLNTDFIPWTVKSRSAVICFEDITHIFTLCTFYTHSITMTPTTPARFTSDYHVKDGKKKTCLPAHRSKYPCQKHHLADTWAGVEVMTLPPHSHTPTQIHTNHWSAATAGDELTWHETKWDYTWGIILLRRQQEGEKNEHLLCICQTKCNPTRAGNEVGAGPFSRPTRGLHECQTPRHGGR